MQLDSLLNSSKENKAAFIIHRCDIRLAHTKNMCILEKLSSAALPPREFMVDIFLKKEVYIMNVMLIFSLHYIKFRYSVTYNICSK